MRTASRRGFTLLEMMTVLSLMAILFAFVGQFYVEVRLASSVPRLQVQMVEQAALSAEWMQRDARAAQAIQFEDATLIFEGPRGVRWRTEPRGLVRTEGRVDRLVAPEVVAMRVHDSEVELLFERPLGGKRNIRISRRFRLTRRTQ